MKKCFTLFFVCALALMGASQSVSFYSYNCPTLYGDTINMGIYAGKKLMVVNVASYCVYTPEYTPLEQLYEQYKKYGFEIIGFPSNDFLEQGGTDSEIISTCHAYDVSFRIMQTVAVISADTAPIYKWLERKDLNGVSDAGITWNFNKFLIDRQGHWVKWYDSPVSPLDTAITNWIIADSAAGILAYRKPVAVYDTADMLQGTIDTINVVANDSDESGDSLCLAAIYGTSNVALTGCSNVVCNPGPYFTGNDTCNYVVCTQAAPTVCDTGILVVSVTSSATAITEPAGNFGISLYPNPANAACVMRLEGKSGPFSASIADVTGREVLPLFDRQSISNFNFSVAGLSPGVYFIKIIDANKSCSAIKLIKE